MISEKTILLTINSVRLVVCRRVAEAKAAGKPDDQLAEVDGELLDLQERIMDEGVCK